MRIVRTLGEIPPSLKRGVVALGNFDGLHLGHQAVIGTALKAARESGVPAGVMTFEPHPRQFFRPDEEPFRLSPFRIKCRLIEAMGVDYLYSQTFDREFSRHSAESFVTDILVGGLAVSQVVVGFDYVFGHNRGGNVDVLRAMAPRHGFKVVAVPELKQTSPEGLRYSSSNVRALLKDGRCAEAARLLGRYWELEGRVEHGDQRGRTLGFPTANLPHGDYLRPAKGVYAVRAGIDHGMTTVWHDGVANFGNRPTFDKKDLLLEVHLFDFSGDLYHRHLRVALVDYIRPERKFAGLEEIKAQLGKDCETARKLLKNHNFNDKPAPFVPVDGAPGLLLP
jgi:riboflavin kinase/FMN adenylyltransferase